MSDDQVKDKENIETVPEKEMKKEIRHEKKEERHEIKENKKKIKENKKKIKKEQKEEKKKQKHIKKLEKIENKIETEEHHHHHHNYHHHDHEKHETQVNTRNVPAQNTTISEENFKVQQQERNIPVNQEWAGIISCDPSDIPDDISLSMSSVDPDEIPDDISISMSSFDPGQSQDSIKIQRVAHNNTESDLSPEIELKEGKAVAETQPNVGQKGVFESNYYQTSESKQ